jgi:hypothetical protein
MGVCDPYAIFVSIVVKFLNHKEHEVCTKYTIALNVNICHLSILFQQK